MMKLYQKSRIPGSVVYISGISGIRRNIEKSGGKLDISKDLISHPVIWDPFIMKVFNAVSCTFWGWLGSRLPENYGRFIKVSC
jgi:hypothetical protein